MQVWVIASGILKQGGDNKSLGKKWIRHFLKYHPAVKIKLGRQTNWERINVVTPDNIRTLF